MSCCFNCLSIFIKSMRKSTNKKSIKSEIYRHDERNEDKRHCKRSSNGNPIDLNDAQADSSNGTRTVPPAITGSVALNRNRNVTNTYNAISKDSFKKPGADANNSAPLSSTCCFRERTELLHNINMFDPATLKHVQAPVTQEKITPLPIAIICWKNGIHPSDPLAAKFRDDKANHTTADDDEDDGDDDDVDEWDD